MTIRHVAMAACCSLAVAGCGSVDSATGDGASFEELSPGMTLDDVDPGERQLLEEETARVQQAFGEPSCASTTADAVLAPGTTSLTSPTASYDHPTCRNAFVVDLPGVTAQRRITGGGWIPGYPDPFTCFFHIGYMGLYEKQGAAYVKVAEGSSFGRWGPTRFQGNVCATPVQLIAPRAGDYKLVVSSAALFGPTDPILVTL